MSAVVTVADRPRSAPPPRRTPRRVPRRPVETTPMDIATLAGCAASAIALNWLVFARLTEGAGWFAVLLTTYATFVILVGLVVTDRQGWLVAADRIAGLLVTTGAVVLLAPLLWLIGYIIVKGASSLSFNFLVDDQRGIVDKDPATAGGGLHAIVGTLEQVGIALVASLPLALACAVFLNETRSRLRRPVRIVVDAMSGLPSIVAGLFIYAVLILPLKGDIFDANGLMGSLALTMLMVPTITRTIEVVLRLVPDGLREAGLALGASRARTVWSVVLPTARSGITTAVVLGIARIAGETAPLLFTTRSYGLMNANPIKGNQESLPMFVWTHIGAPSQRSVDRAYVGALVLMLVVLTLFALARIIGRDRKARP